MLVMAEAVTKEEASVVVDVVVGSVTVVVEVEGSELVKSDRADWIVVVIVVVVVAADVTVVIGSVVEVPLDELVGLEDSTAMSSFKHVSCWPSHSETV